jgi:hypothetical protein
LWRRQYGLPVIIDECGYEGNIEFQWGNLSAYELVNRAWMAVSCGGFITHGETFHRKDEVLWWAKGGRLYGESTERFRFLKDLQYEIGNISPAAPAININPNDTSDSSPLLHVSKYFREALTKLSDNEKDNMSIGFAPMAGSNADYRLQYLGRSCPVYFDLKLPKNGSYRVEVIDVWEMTRKSVLTEAYGEIRIDLPAKEGIAVLVTRHCGEGL